MNILLVGSGGREHALAWKLKQSNLCTQLFIAPGNAGTSLLGTNLPIVVNDFELLKAACLKNNITMMVVGPEEPLVNGIYDDFKNDTEKEIKKLYHFLEIDETVKLNLNKTHNPFSTPRNKLFRFIYQFKPLRLFIKNIFSEKLTGNIKNIILTKKKSVPSENTVNYLRVFFKPDIIKLEKLLNRNLSAWYE